MENGVWRKVESSKEVVEHVLEGAWLRTHRQNASRQRRRFIQNGMYKQDLGHSKAF